ncbi:hypothetical protein D1872_274150 [compost metagenome]
MVVLRRIAHDEHFLDEGGVNHVILSLPEDNAGTQDDFFLSKVVDNRCVIIQYFFDFHDRLLCLIVFQVV